MRVHLTDTGWYSEQLFNRRRKDWRRRIGFIQFYCYRCTDKPPEWEAHIVLQPFGSSIRKRFKSQGGPRRYCERLINRMYLLLEQHGDDLAAVKCNRGTNV